MSSVKVINGFDKLSDPALLVKAQRILTRMTGNEHYPTPIPTLAEYGAGIAAYDTALDAAGSGGDTTGSGKNDRRDALIVQMRALGRYVEFACGGNRTKALSSGFDLEKERSPRPPITAPGYVRLTDTGNPGEMLAEYERVPNAISYVVSYRTITDTEGPVQMVPVSGRKVVLTGLLPNTLYRVEVTALGPRQQRMTSQPAFRATQPA